VKDWHQQLTPEQFHILREKGTERAFTGQYWNVARRWLVSLVRGAVRCSSTRCQIRFRHGDGRASPRPPVRGRRGTHEDNGFLMHRTEVVCRACGGHLGHVFPDGPDGMPRGTGINSASLDLKHRADSPATTPG